MLRRQGVFLFTVVASSVFIVGILVHFNSVHEIDIFNTGRINTVFSAVVSEYATNKSKELTTRKPFVYLTETEQCLPPYLALTF